MKTKLKFGLSQMRSYAPKWLINSTSIIALIISAKHYLIQGLPGVDNAVKILAMQWMDYALNLAQVLLALGVIFTSEQAKGD